MKKKLAILLVLMMAVVLLFAACGEEDKPAEHVHDYGTLIAEVPATCTEAGTKAHYHCSGCNKDFDEDKNEVTDLAIPATGHTEVTDAAVEATCTTEGKTAGKHCSVCGTVTEAQQVIPAKGHTEVVTPGVAPTCTVAGKTESSYCSVCHKVIVAQKVIPATGHTEVIDEGRPATCTEDGLTEGKHCSVCNEVIVAQEVIPAAHTFEEWVEGTPATCTEDGTKGYFYCTVCEKYIEADGKTEITDFVIPAPGHDYEWVEEVAPTCSNAGIKAHYHCDACGKDFNESKEEVTAEDLAIAATGHTWTNLYVPNVAPASCYEDGMKAHYYCPDCGKYFDARNKKEVAREDLIVTGTHTFSSLIAEVPATCDTNGTVAHYHCSVCGKDFDKNKNEISDLVIPAPGHKYTQTGELTKKGTTYVFPCRCTVCGKNVDAECKLTANYRTFLYDGDTCTGISEADASNLEAHYYCAGLNKYLSLDLQEITPADLATTAIGIYNETDLLALVTLIENGNAFAGETFKICADLDMTGKNFDGLGNKDTPFSGNIDGQGHTVTLDQSYSGTQSDIGGLIRFLAFPTSGGTITVQNVRVAGKITIAPSAHDKADTHGGLITCTRSALTGSGECTLNIINCQSSVFFQISSNRVGCVGGFLAWIGHQDGYLAPTTVNIESCLWDGTINAGAATSDVAGFIGNTGLNKKNRTLTINIKNSVAAGKIMLNVSWSDNTAMIIGNQKSNYAEGTTTVNVENVVCIGRMTSSVKLNATNWFAYFNKQNSAYGALNLTNFYYYQFNVGGVEPLPLTPASGAEPTTQTNVAAKTMAEMTMLTGADFTEADQWSISDGYYPCPASIIATFGASEALIAPHFHMLSEWHEEVPATEEADGTKGYYQCLKCGKYLAKDGETVITDLVIPSMKLTISSAEDLAAFRDAVNAGADYSGQTVRLTADIDISGSDWDPIGTYTYPFNGSFDGQGHTISGLTQVRSDAIGAVGLFRIVTSPDGEETTIQNFKLTGSIQGKKGGETAGTVICCVVPSTTGTVTVNVKNIWSTVNFTAEGALMKGVGGIVGSMAWKTSDQHCTLNIDSCRYSGTMDSPSQGSNDYGGILGWARENACPRTFNISNCLFDGAMTLNGSNPDDNGGILGYLKGNQNETFIGCNISNCIVAGQFNHPNKENYAVTGYVLSECSKKTDTNTAYTVTNVYYCNDADRHTGADLGGWYGYYKKGDGAISPLITYENVTAKTMDELSTMTEGFADDTAWDFGTETEIPVPKTLVDAFGR